MQHTKGEWKLGYDQQTLYVGDNATNIKIICDIKAACNTSDEESKANAHILKASKDMYEALEMFAKAGHHDTCDAVKLRNFECSCGYDKAKKALQKANHHES